MIFLNLKILVLRNLTDNYYIQFIIKNIIMITRRIYDVMTCNNVLTKLAEQQINFSINIAYKLHKLKNELDEIEQLIFQRWELLFGENFNVDTFTQEEITAYNLTLEAEVNIDIYDLKIDDII